jgi:ATP-dependent protease HslVU (ClpYQ) peptidase subunit
MSVVCCRVSKKFIEIASDDQVTWGDVKLSDQNTSRCKLIQVNGMIIGASGATEELQMLRLFCLNHKPVGHSESDVLLFLSEFAEWKNQKTKKYALENTCIFIFDKHAFEIYEFDVSEIVSYSAIGSGRDYALAAMFLKCGLKRAIQVASKFNLYCSGEVKYFKISK